MKVAVLLDIHRHCLSWQAVVAPDGLCCSLFGHVEGRLHDSIAAGYSGPTSTRLSADEAHFNTTMSQNRQAVEWYFGKSLWPTTTDATKMQLLKVNVGKISIAILLTNCHACINANLICEYFGLQPPELDSYLGAENWPSQMSA
ncbi:TPA: hypothetical protein N0F65_002309 [Lagenidium giganteum]|uniref:Transposase n=1 Tax=Lagenidium giganteum TaxID=4803 RepID=A0AAV2Z6J1_9STRA|nr:TPA: hypothetical protein N0F65_002309 [Lagenidium giganteum]